MPNFPPDWKKSEKSLRAVQLAFEFSKAVADTLRAHASQQGLSPSDQIRAIIGLSTKKPQRPRLTVSLSEEDYVQLSQRYGIPVEDKSTIREAIVKDILHFSAAAESNPPQSKP